MKAAQRGADLAAETLDLVRSQYEAGTVTQIDLLAAQDNLVIAQESLASARFDVAIADLALRRSAGTFPPDSDAGIGSSSRSRSAVVAGRR